MGKFHTSDKHFQSSVWEGEKKYTTKCYKEEYVFFSHSDSLLINNFVDCSLLVPRASNNVLVIHRDITAKHRRGFFGLEYTGSIRCSPCIQKIIFSSAYKPFATVSEFQGQHTTLMKMQLILVWFSDMQHLHIAVLHSYCQPFTSWTITQ